ncbi:MAG: hypothetical protein Pg6A_18410 [Termitinemataceae bacterium]|nr:MAG: hypothetical protein Pg6A_18410 [Termitinemataceae bacterium]
MFIIFCYEEGEGQFYFCGGVKGWQKVRAVIFYISDIYISILVILFFAILK